MSWIFGVVKMKELRDNLGQLIFWGIAFGILLGILSLAGCETPKKSNCKQETTLPNNNNIHCEDCQEVSKEGGYMYVFSNEGYCSKYYVYQQQQVCNGEECAKLHP